VALRTGRPLSACAGWQELLPLSQALAFDFHPCWATGQNLTQRLRWVTSWCLPYSYFVRRNQFLPENFLRNAGFEPDIAPRVPSKIRWGDFRRSWRLDPSGACPPGTSFLHGTRTLDIEGNCARMSGVRGFRRRQSPEFAVR
jgi:hypothetical protein